MQKRFRSSDSNAPSRRELVLLAGAVSATVAGALAADAQAASIVVPPATEAVSPFSISLPQTAIDDLKRRLDSIRYPERETVGGWTQGVPLDKARALIEYWRDHYDWRRFEARTNSFPHFRTRIDGLGIHFIHARSSHTNAMPIVFTHGWPGSFVEFLEVIGPLTEPTRFGGNADDAFHVVVPSLPGFAFSDKPSETGWEVERIARAWATLMQRLGYERWVAQGGDWGSGVTHALARLRPPGLIAAHVNWPFVFPSKLPENPTPAEKRAFERAAWFQGEQSGYFREQATRPQTIGYALADSAAGQALWIYEKFQAWTDNRGNPEDALSIDAMLDDVSLYWFTNTAASSARIYWENTQSGRATSQLGASSCPWPRQSSRGRFFVRQGNGLRPSGRTCFTGTSLIRAGTLLLSNNRSNLPRRCAKHSSHGEDDLSASSRDSWLLLAPGPRLERAGVRQSVNESMRESHA
jgi:epoxide hydrolase